MTAVARRREVVAAAALYALVTVAFTWPLVRGIAHDIPGDYGDPLLNAWILAWDATHAGRGWWNANIFYPHPLALGYSEHLAAQAAQILPVYWLTRNPILCYNLVFLSTFVLAGLGAFLLARELTGNATAAMVAGLAFAFAPYRVSSLPHIQVLSSAWMPFTLYAFRRYFVAGRSGALVGAAAAWTLQNLSCGYYLLFFSPIVVMYLVWELTTRRLWTDARVVGSIAVACAAVALVTVPFVLPYLQLRRLGFNPRSLTETRKFSADVYGYFTADPNVHLWGSVARAWPKAEGALFPGLTTAILAALGAGRPFQGRLILHDPKRVALLLIALVLMWLLLGFSVRLPGLKITSLSRAVVIATALVFGLLAWSRDLRRAAIEWMRTPAGCFTLLTAFAIVMSFGPDIRARDRVVLGSNVYAFFYQYVPGVDGLRVPARFGMIVALGLAVLAGLGAAAIRRTGAALAVGVLVLVESLAAPIPINQNSPDYQRPGLAALPDLQRNTPAVYDAIAALPPASAIAELPLGEPAFDVRYMYYSTRHWRPLVNGYTGGLPQDYETLDHALQDLFTRPDRAWTTLRQSRPTHVVVHEAYYADDRGPRVSEWLRSNGARDLGSFGADRLFEMP